MKRIKTFEQMYNDKEIEAELGNIPREADISPEEFKVLCDEAIALGNVDNVTKALVKLKYKYQPKENPSLENIYYDAIKKWHKMGTPSRNLIIKGWNEMPGDQHKFNL